MQDENDVMNIIDNKIPVEKKKPGRPRKKVVSMPIEIHGIVNEPIDKGDEMELAYCNPIMFKKLMQLYKAFEVSEIEMIFDTLGVKIITKDHLGKSIIYSTIDGRCMNFYYCKKPIRICIKRDNLERVLSTINKNHYKITFQLKEDYRSTMYLTIKDSEYNNENEYEVEVGTIPEEVIIGKIKDDESNYPISFKISSKHFKTTINNSRKISQTFTIQKCGDEPLQFTFDKPQKVNWIGVYNDPEKINLQSSLKDDDIFIVSVFIDHIKPFSNSNIGEEVFIYADKKEKMCFMTRMDKKDIGWACSVKIFTEIKNYRRFADEEAK